MFGNRGERNSISDRLRPCGPDEIRMEDGTVRIMTEVELLDRRIDDATEECQSLCSNLCFARTHFKCSLLGSKLGTRQENPRHCLVSWVFTIFHTGHIDLFFWLIFPSVSSWANITPPLFLDHFIYSLKC